MFKKIGFTGSHAVGKTTLLYEVASEIQKLGFNVALVNETARETRHPINSQAGILAQTDIFALQLHNELDVSARQVDVILTDRTILDAVAYTYLAELDGRIPLGLADSMLPLAIKWLETYDLIIYVKPFDGDFASDRERWCSRKSQRQIDSILMDLYIDNNCDLVVLDSNCPLGCRKDSAVAIARGLLE